MEHSDLVRNLCKPAEEISNEMTAEDAHLIHMIMGVAGEVGELLDAIKKHVIYHKSLDIENVIEEMGDIEFYLEGLRQGMNIDRREVIIANVVKLSKRYSSGSYSDNQAKERADKTQDTMFNETV